MKKCKKVLKIALNVFVWLFVAFSIVVTIMAFAATANADGVPSLGGKCFLSVLTPSMSGTFEQGDLIVGEMLSGEEKISLQVGDVITYKADLNGDGTNEINSHRIVRINKDANGEVVSYVTQGDNKVTNPVEDAEPVRWQYVISKWTGSRIGGVGAFLAFLQQPKGFLIVIVLPLVLFFLYEVYVFIKTLLGVKNAGKKQITAADEELIRQRAIEEYIRQQKEKEASENTAKEEVPVSATEKEEATTAEKPAGESENS